MKNKEFTIAAIKNLCKRNYGVNPAQLDLEALVDSTLSMPENWFKIKNKVLMLCQKEHKLLFL